MRESTLLEIDGFGNVILGLLFILLPVGLADTLGIPLDESSLYSTVLGGILIGIGVALLVERFGRGERVVGLGLVGAISINLSFGIVLGVWLLIRTVEVSRQGTVLLWLLVIILVGISLIELLSLRKNRA